MVKLLGVGLMFSLVSCSSGIGPVVPESGVERKMLGLLEKFDRWDDDGNGELSAKELNSGFRSVKTKPNEKRYTGAEVVQFYDTDQSGTISLREAQAGYSRASEFPKKP